jgi:hypothetical protein
MTIAPGIDISTERIADLPLSVREMASMRRDRALLDDMIEAADQHRRNS